MQNEPIKHLDAGDIFKQSLFEVDDAETAFTLNAKCYDAAIRSFAELIDEIPNRVRLSAQDLAQSLTRQNEPMWHQQVRNITSHKNSPGNAIHDGRLIAIPGGLALASKSVA